MKCGARAVERSWGASLTVPGDLCERDGSPHGPRPGLPGLGAQHDSPVPVGDLPFPA